MNQNVLSLDFDGVICDSASECVVSAYGVFSSAKNNMPNLDPTQVPDYFRNGFYNMRPFIRDGKDYLLILHLLDLGVIVETQVDFDQEMTTRMPDLLKLFAVEAPEELEAAFQGYRSKLRHDNEDKWMALNPLYMSMKLALNDCLGWFEHIFVTTSKPTVVAEQILGYNGLYLPEGHVIGKDKVGLSTNKNVHMQMVSDISGVTYTDIHFVDDQVTHLKDAKGLGVQCYLATWGYNVAEQFSFARRLNILLLDESTLAEWMVGLIGPK